MISNLDPNSQRFLDDLSRVQNQTARAQQQLSSGYKVQVASDAPDQISSLLQLEASLARNTQVATNLNNVQAEVNAGESAVSSAVQLLQAAVTLGTQGANVTQTAQSRSVLASQVQALQEQLVGLSNTTVQGRYIFSGDQGSQPSYQVDLASPNGVDRLQITTATRQITDADGASFPVDETAGDLFDHRNPDDSLASDNVFAALNSLRLALSNNDPTAVSSALDSLHTSADYLNGQLSNYGTAQDRIKSALDAATNQAVSLKTGISSIRDTDFTEATLEFTAGTTQQQTALAARAKMPRTSLFDYLA